MRPTLHESWIDSSAIDIVERLQNRKFEAYLVGGCVRDLLVNVQPKDFDIATSAKPEEVRKMIPHSYLIGRRFKLILVRRGGNQYEVSTFRRNKGPDDDTAEEIPIEGDNFFGTALEDAIRRDFTVNALFYDPIQKNIIDHCGGLADVEARLIKIIGDPEKRLIEDPIRILRGLRLAHKLDFNLDDSMREAISLHGSCLKSAILPRKREEYLKIMKLDDPSLAFLEMYDLNLMEHLLPSLVPIFEQEENRLYFMDLLRDLKNHFSFSSESSSLFFMFLYAIIQSHPELSNKTTDELENHEVVSKLIREELGIFKQEAIHFFKTLEFMPNMMQKDLYLRKGERRKKAFLSHPQFLWANELNLFEKNLKYSDYFFWKTELMRQNSSLNAE